MKHRVAALVAGCGLACVVVAVALGGSTGDPLVSKSYLEGTFAEDVSQAMAKKAEEASQSTYNDAEKKLEQLAGDDLAQAEKAASQDSGTYAKQSLSTGDTVKLTAGDSLMFYSGGAKVGRGALADVTSGKSLSVSAALTAGHRYIATADTTVTLTSGGSAGLEGTAQVLKSGEKEPLPFTDVKEGDWYYDAISFVYEQGYFSGMGGNLFAPNTSMSRSMLATVLYRLSGESYSGAASFSDVPDDLWYTTAVAWASEKGIVNGMGGNVFAPDELVTREQMVTMLYRYQSYKKGNTSARGSLSDFPDGDAVSSWAKDGVEWAVGKKLLTGRNTGHLDPSGTATRAEVATILQRFAALS